MMFKEMIKTINEETGETVTKVLAVSLITKELFAHHGMNAAKAHEAIDCFAADFAGELYLVETDLGHIMVDFDNGTYQLVCPGFASAHYCLNYLYETAKDLNEDRDSEVTGS